jgi:hypothetical protein
MNLIGKADVQFLYSFKRNYWLQLPCKLKKEKSEDTSLQNLASTNGNANLPGTTAKETTWL